MTTEQITPPRVAQPRVARLSASRWLPLPVVLSGTFMVVLDFFIINAALPSTQSDLHASDGAIEWVGAGYARTGRSWAWRRSAAS